MTKLLISLLLTTCLLATEWGTSLSIRTPNDGVHPLDYEVSIRVNDTEGKLQYLLKRDWERELGEKYIDDVVHLRHEILPHLYYGIDYVDKESKQINYTTYNIGSTIGWFSIGASFKQLENDITPLLNIALSHTLSKDGLEYTANISAKSNIYDDNIINVKTEVKKWLSSKFNIFALYKHEYYNEKEDFQFKVGFGVKL